MSQEDKLMAKVNTRWLAIEQDSLLYSGDIKHLQLHCALHGAALHAVLIKLIKIYGHIVAKRPSIINLISHISN